MNKKIFYFKKTAPIIKYVLINYMCKKQGLLYPTTINLRTGTQLLRLFSVNPILTQHS